MSLRMTRREFVRAGAVASLLLVGCDQASDEPKLLEPQVMSSVAESWDRIHRWLGKNAPRILQSLRPGATKEALAAAEESIGTSMPNDWRELYLAHDGMSAEPNHGSLFHGMDFFPLEKMKEEMRETREQIKELGGKYVPLPVHSGDSGIDRTDLHHLKWVPFAHDWGETMIKVDMAPASGGVMGQVIATDIAFAAALLIAPSLSRFLAAFADDLEAGRYFLHKDSLAKGHEFLDCVPEIDVSNWYKSPRWKHLQ